MVNMTGCLSIATDRSPKDWRFGEGRSCTTKTGGPGEYRSCTARTGRPGKIGAVLRELDVRGR